MRVTAAGFLVAVTVAATGCGAHRSNTAISAADCADQVRLRGIVYTSYGFTDHAATRFAVAEQAACQNNGKDPRGSVFPDSPDQVATWSFHGYPTDKVLGVRRGDSLAVFVAESVSQS